MEANDPAADRLMATGVVPMNAGDYDLALRVFQRLAETRPAFAEGWNKRATLLYLLGRYRESVADIARVLALEPRHFGAVSGLALCDEQLGRDADALQALRRTTAIYPNMPGLKERIAGLTKKVEGKPPRADSPVCTTSPSPLIRSRGRLGAPGFVPAGYRPAAPETGGSPRSLLERNGQQGRGPGGALKRPGGQGVPQVRSRRRYVIIPRRAHDGQFVGSGPVAVQNDGDLAGDSEARLLRLRNAAPRCT